MTREAMEFHDSVVGNVVIADHTVRVELSPAYIHRSDGEPASDAGTGWSANVELTIHEGILKSLPAEFPSDVWEGSLSVGGREFENIVPLPFEGEGHVLLLITLNSGQSIRITGERVALRVVGAYEFVEEFGPG